MDFQGLSKDLTPDLLALPGGRLPRTLLQTAWSTRKSTRTYTQLRVTADADTQAHVHTRTQVVPCGPTAVPEIRLVQRPQPRPCRVPTPGLSARAGQKPDRRAPG